MSVQAARMTKVLLVEDEPAIADTLVYAMETERFEVTHVLTGRDALAKIAAHRYDFIILDVGLPDMTGFEVCRKLRESSSVPVLFLTTAFSDWRSAVMIMSPSRFHRARSPPGSGRSCGGPRQAKRHRNKKREHFNPAAARHWNTILRR